MDEAKRRKLLKNKIGNADVDAVLQSIVAENIQLPKISAMDVLWVKFLRSPATLTKYAWWHLSWYRRITLNKEKYTTEDKIYLIKKNLSLPSSTWHSMSDDARNELIDLELWDSEKAAVYILDLEKTARKREELKERRWMRKYM